MTVKTCTCALSGLPIEVGTPVRVLLLTQNPSHSGTRAGSPICQPHDYWVPRTFAYKNSVWGTHSYADACFTWRELLMRDMVELPWNATASFSQIPVRADDSMNELIVAAHAGRLFVHNKNEEPTSVVPHGIPTWRRVEKWLQSNGLCVAKRKYDDGLRVYKAGPTTICIRGEEGFAESVEKACNVLSEPFSVQKVNGGLIVNPRPETPAWSPRLIRPKLAVTVAQIREEVWQHVTIAASKQKRDAIRTILASCLGDSKYNGSARHREEWDAVVGFSEPRVVGLFEHWVAFLTRHLQGDARAVNVREFAENAIDTAYMLSWCTATRRMLLPSPYFEQLPDAWERHVTSNKNFAAIARRVIDH